MKSQDPAESSPDILPQLPLRPHLVAAIILVLTAVIMIVVIWRSEQNRLHIERARVSEMAGDHAHAIQANIERALSATYSLAAMVRQGKGAIPDFEATASEMIPFYPGVGSLQLAPGGVIKSIVPLAGNQGAIGHDLLKDPARTKEAFLARDTGKLTLAGPFSLIQGGVGAVGRLPVFLYDGAGRSSSFWGFTTVLIRFPEVLASARLSNLEERGFRYELWRMHPDTGKRQVIAASLTAPPVNPVDRLLELPNGTWTLSVAPSNGWGNPGGLALKAVTGLIISLLMYTLTRSLLNTRAMALQMAIKLTSDLRRSEEQLRLLIKNSPVAMLVESVTENRITLLNDNFTQLFGYTIRDIPSITEWWSLAYPDESYREQVRSDWSGKMQKVASERGEIVPVEATVTCRNGTHCIVEFRLSAIDDRNIVTFIDLTERKRAEEEIHVQAVELEQEVAERRSAQEELQEKALMLEIKINELGEAQEALVRKEKLAILGQLSGSVGHELRNPLGVMSNAVYFLKMVHSDADETTKEYLGIIKNEIDNSLRIITDLLDFARTKPPQIKAVTARELTDESLGRCAIPVNFELRTEIPENLPLLRVDPLQMGQVLTNFITNAIQAMPDGGALRVTARHVGSGLVPAQPGYPQEAPLQNFIAISVTDTGVGIAPENMKKLFQPLFTTKAKGIGLGLVVCKNLVEANGGRIEVKSELGKGTTFVALMPAGEAAHCKN